MELLGMVPADAIALRLYSLPAAAAAAGSLCAWLVAALAAAAVGLWRIRAVGAASNSKPGAVGVCSVSALVNDDDKKPQAAPLPSRAAIADEPRRRPVALAPAEPSSSSVSEPSTPSKVRFTAYYGGSGSGDHDGVVDGVRKCADDADDVDGDGARGRDSEREVKVVLRRTVSEPGRRRATSLGLDMAPWDEEREMAVRRRRSDLGWYRHIDMAALDGSVVRLWDGDLTAASPRGRRTRAGLELQLSL